MKIYLNDKLWKDVDKDRKYARDYQRAYRAKKKRKEAMKQAKVFVFGSLFALLVGFMVTPSVIEYTSKIVPEAKAEIPELSLVERVVVYAKQYGVDPLLMVKLIDCETAGTWKEDVQSNYKYKKGALKGQRELSFGLAQIHLPDHKEITKAQAKDIDFALDFMAGNIKDGNIGIWSCNKLIK